MGRPRKRVMRHSTNWFIEADPVAVAEAIRGRVVRLVPAELREITGVLTARGWSARAIAEHIDCSSRTVIRHRVALGIKQG